MASLLTPDAIVSSVPTSKSLPTPVFASVQRLDSDPVFNADVTIDNAVIGSRYWLVDDTDYSTILATGIITSDPEVLSSIPAFSTNFLMLLRLRKATTPVLYKQFETKIKHNKIGSSTFVIQEEDT